MREITLNDKLYMVMDHPIGSDLLNRVLFSMKIKKSTIDNFAFRNLKLSTLNKFLIKRNMDILPDLLYLLNSSNDTKRGIVHSEIKKQWWKEAVVYQIYPKSYKDSDGDGHGDIRGIIEKLPYLHDLGINAIWLSPIYDSPMDDNGYDIRDYESVLPEFGTMKDMEELLEKAHNLGIKIIMDMVLNHSSDEHVWFQKALKGEKPYEDYYIKMPDNGQGVPNNWISFFGGSAWKKFPGNENYWLHLFSSKQMDLNWDNPQLRKELHDIMDRWLQKGVDGFRLDVVNLISKNPPLSDGNTNVYNLMGFLGIEHYFYGMNLHKYLKEMREKVFDKYNAFTVGEMPGVGINMGKLLTAEDRNELSTLFLFDHLENPGESRMSDYIYDLNNLKAMWISEQNAQDNNTFGTLFTDNHDNPRMITKIDPEGRYKYELSKLISTLLLTLRGIPFFYQGQEIGMSNTFFSSIDEFRDVESLNFYKELIANGKSEEQAIKATNAYSRDNARIPMQWDSSANYGFTSGKSWIKTSDDEHKYTVEYQTKEEGSIFNFMKQLIEIRKKNDCLVYGDTIFFNKKKKNFFGYFRVYKNSKFYVEINLSKLQITAKKPKENLVLLLSNYDEDLLDNKLRAYEVNIYKCK